MKKTLFNQRLCVVTHQKYNKEELIKLTKEEGIWDISTNSYTGRSIYILNQKEIIDKFLKIKKYKIKHFEMNDSLREKLEVYAQSL